MRCASCRPLSRAMFARGASSATAASRGLSAATIGLLLALATFLRILISPLAGLVADAKDDRRLVMLVFTACAVVAFVALVFVQDTDDIFLAAMLGLVLWNS